jgi:hypothetical protein
MALMKRCNRIQHHSHISTVLKALQQVCTLPNSWEKYQGIQSQPYVWLHEEQILISMEHCYGLMLAPKGSRGLGKVLLSNDSRHLQARIC